MFEYPFPGIFGVYTNVVTDRVHISIFTGKIKIICIIKMLKYQDIFLFAILDDFFQRQTSVFSIMLEILQINYEWVSEQLVCRE